MTPYEEKKIPRQAWRYLTGYVVLFVLNSAWTTSALVEGLPGVVFVGVSIAMVSLALLHAGAVYGIGRIKQHSNGMWAAGLMATIAAMDLAVLIAVV
jgi:hypothetical protein